MSASTSPSIDESLANTATPAPTVQTLLPTQSASPQGYEVTQNGSFSPSSDESTSGGGISGSVCNTNGDTITNGISHDQSETLAGQAVFFPQPDVVTPGPLNATHAHPPGHYTVTHHQGGIVAGVTSTQHGQGDAPHIGTPGIHRPTQNNGANSPNRYSPNVHPTNPPHSRDNSPRSNGEGGVNPAGGQQHVVHVHVNPGETFSVRIGEQIQHIQGRCVR